MPWLPGLEDFMRHAKIEQSDSAMCVSEQQQSGTRYHVPSSKFHMVLFHSYFTHPPRTGSP